MTKKWPTAKAVPCRSMPQCEFVKIREKIPKKKRRKIKTEDADAIVFQVLANYLKYLDQNDDEYYRYFAWKTNPPKNLPDYESRFCELCKKLVQASPTERKVYTDIDRWWRGENYEFCQPMMWVGAAHSKKEYAARFP
ncbi:Hypp817 [Branchiostoma lanceolatum]|uniref:Fucosyltransferase n=1 Tax=Branchiostoma lanceolatum TaxID=7740 RepID=A0A8J9YM25_BRALA|nr:Hypp817 [Branchiostoma lanceolatum]